MSAVIFEYIKVRRGGKVHKVGVITATEIDREIRIGWSKCNTALDAFNSDQAQVIAVKRIRGEEKMPPTPDCIKRQVRQFAARSVRYFQDATLVKIPA